MVTMATLASDALRREAFRRLQDAEAHLGVAEAFIKENDWVSVGAKLEHAAAQYQRAAAAFRAINQPQPELTQ